MDKSLVLQDAACQIHDHSEYLRPELAALRSVIKGPGLWAPLSFFLHLRRISQVAGEFISFALWCRITMLRTALVSARSYTLLHDELNNCITDDSLLVHRFPQWLESCSGVNLHNAVLAAE